MDPKASGVSQGDGVGSRAGGMRLVVANEPAICGMVISATLNELRPHAQDFAGMDFEALLSILDEAERLHRSPYLQCQH